jgi:SAM-dependent methyltransferase
MTDPDVITRMSAQYAPTDLRARVDQLLRRAGLDETNTTLEALAGLDQLHVEGQAATTRLAELAKVTSDDLVLDVCCGMAGPARYLAQTFGCTVHGIDLTTPFLETAELLNALTGLSDKVVVERGDATDMRFADETFDLAWTQNGAQNIADKAGLLGELHRVLKPGGRCVMHDLLRGPGEPIHFPSILGADETEFAAINFLVSADEMRALVADVGFAVQHWRDLTQLSLAANREMASEPETQHHGSVLDISVVLGEEELPELADNSVRDFEVRSIEVFEAVLVKP